MTEPVEIHFERDLEVAYETAEAALREGAERWLPGFERRGELVTGVLRYQRAGVKISRQTEVGVGPVQRFAYGVTVHVDWKGARHPEVYPELDGHVRLERHGERGTRLRFDARYTPPVGRMGAGVDRAVMHHVAESAVRDFVDEVATRLSRG